ncbi:unnamed protein product [Polarella glacialis]|uniref:Uncharacterized protein n=1 Tax=Polarella glacialis TaxID=89957 RepID=A0A813J0I1_POLGL|nr:unnamed protein product [Polarella glacialis]
MSRWSHIKQHKNAVGVNMVDTWSSKHNRALSLSPPGYKKAASGQMLMQAECYRVLATPYRRKCRCWHHEGNSRTAKDTEQLVTEKSDVHLHGAKRAITRDFFNASPKKALRECFKTR